MLIDIRKDDPRPVYRQIADEVQRAVSVGIFKPGDLLPASRAVAADLKVNTNTVQHAYRTLAREGTIVMRRGLGAYVAAKPREPRRSGEAVARQIVERALREAFSHGLLASDLLTALKEISPEPTADGSGAGRQQ